MEHIAALINGWRPKTLWFLEEGSSYFVEHLSMATSERINLFTQSIIYYTMQEQSSNLRSIHQQLFPFLLNVKWMSIEASKFLIIIHMLKEPIKGSFFPIQADFCFTNMNFTGAKFGKDPLN